MIKIHARSGDIIELRGTSIDDFDRIAPYLNPDLVERADCTSTITFGEPGKPNGHKAPKQPRKPAAPLSDNDKARVIGYLRAHPGSTASKIAEATKVSDVSRILRALGDEVRSNGGKGRGATWSAVAVEPAKATAEGRA